MTSVEYVRILEGRDRQWYYESRAANHQVLSTSEGYTRERDARRAAEAEHPGVRIEPLADA